MVLVQLAASVLLALPQGGDPTVVGRRQLQHGDLLKSLTAQIEAAADDKAKGKFAARLARVRLEADLLQRAAPLSELPKLGPQRVLRELAPLPKSATEELVLAELAFLLGSVTDGEAALGRARDRDPSRGVRDRSNAILARARKERVPRGGYHRYRGEWLALARRDRCRALDEALAATVGLRLEGVSLPFELQTARTNRPAFDGLGQAAGDAWLRAAATQVRTALAGDYGTVRRWLGDQTRPSARRQAVVTRREMMRKPQAEALALIRRYSKIEQPQVDGNRDALARIYKGFRADFDREMRRYLRIQPEDAFALHERIEDREAALTAIDRYFAVTKAPRLPAGVRPATPGGPITREHVLPGRRMSGLEDTLWLLVKFRAGLVIDTLRRVEDLLRYRKKLTKWEGLLLDEIRADAVDELNARLATSLDAEELAFVAVTNAYRRTLGLRPFELEERLNVSAKKHSQEMVDLGYFGHVSPIARNRTPTDRARLEGYSGGVGENCLAGSVDGRGAFRGWYYSPGHHRNLVSGGPHLGVGAVRRHSMWTMVAGGTDWSWRLLHKDLAPAARARLQGLVDGLIREAVRPEAKHKPEALMAARALVVAEIPGILPMLARRVFPIARDPSHAKHPAFAVGLGILIDAKVHVPWRPLQVAAVAAAIEAMRTARTPSLRGAAYALVRPRIVADLPFDPAAPRDRVAEMVQAFAKAWEDTDQWRYRTGRAVPPAPVRIVGRESDGPSLAAPRLMLSRRERLRMAKKFGGDARTEQAVENGLKFLAKVQDSDGAWRARSFGLRLPGFQGDPGRGNADWEIAMTGLSLLAFTSAGYTTEQGPYQDAVRRGTEFLMSRLVDYGRFDTVASHYMYCHALGAQALCEVFSYSADPAVGAAAQLSIDYLVHAQHQDSGGWRYAPNQHGDTSVTGWVIMALNSAYKAQVEVSGFRPARRFLDTVTKSPYYEVGYMNPNDHGTHGLRLTAVAMTGRLFLGGKARDSRLVLPAYRMMDQLPRPQAVDFYYWYYATLALFQVGEPFWKKWNAALKKTVLGLQERSGPLRGSWAARGQWSNYGGRVYQTALGVLMLTTYYRYDRAPKTRTHPYTGDIDKHAKAYFDTLRHEKDGTRRNLAFRRMIDLFGPSLVGPIARILKAGKEKAGFRQGLARMLVDIAERRHGPLLLELLADKDEKVVVEVVEAFSRSASRADARKLVGALDSRHRAVRAHCALWLGRLGDPTQVGAIQKRLSVERDGWVKGELQKALLALTRRSELMAVLAKVLPAETEGYLAIVDGLVPFERAGMVPDLAALDPKDLREALIKDGGAAAIPVLFLVMRSDALGARQRAQKLIRALTRRSFGFDPKGSGRARATALANWRKWWRAAAAGFGS